MGAKAPQTLASLGGASTAALAAHEADTTNVHGIADTSALVLTTDARIAGYGEIALEPYSRVGGAIQSTSFNSGVLRIAFARAKRVKTITRLASCCAAAWSSTTPTLCRMGVFSVDPTTYDMTLLARVANDTTLWSSANTVYKRNFDTAGGYPSSFTTTVGAIYGMALLRVTTGSMPTFSGCAWTAGNIPGDSDLGDMISRVVNSQTDIASSYTFAQTTTGGNSQWVVGLT